MSSRILAIVALSLLGLVLGLDMFIGALDVAGWLGVLPSNFDFLRFISRVKVVLRVPHEIALLGALACLGFGLLGVSPRSGHPPRPGGPYGPPGW